MFKALREKLGRRSITNSSARHRIDYRGFDTVKSVCILVDASRPEDMEVVKKYLHYLREFGKKAKVIGYYPDGKVPEMTYSRMEYIFFSSADLDFLRRPKSEEVKQFLEEPVDMLIDLNLQGLFPLYYIAALSKASLKVGRNGENNEIYDLMIEMSADKGIKYFLRNLDQYLEMLGPKKTQKV